MRSLSALFVVSLFPPLCAQSLPRPEFPQPQFERAQWLSLNGPWQFRFDDANAGLDQHWNQADKAAARGFDRSITVPYCFESKLSGIGDTAFHPWIWYRREISIPAAWQGQRVLLHFGAVDYRAMVWMNGQLLGEHEGGNVPFQFDITAALQPGTNTLTVRAEDPPTDRYIPRGKQFWERKSASIFYTRTSGIWQPVWLEAAGESYLKAVRITPSNDGAVRFDAEVERPQPGLELRAILKDGGTVSAITASSRAALLLTVSEPKLWAPGHPNLYDVTFELRKGAQVLDRVNSYFGFRSVMAENGRFLLNDHPEYLKFVLDQGYWPDSILTPPSDEAIQYDIKICQQMGFNGARKHQKLEDPRYLYWADRLGFLVSSEMANAYRFDERSVEAFTKEWTAAVARDYNHPSIVLWVPINESWGVPDVRDARQPAYLKELYYLTHALDRTRLVIDNDGWEHTDATDLFAIHDYTSSGDKLYARYRDLGKPVNSIPDNARRALTPGYAYNGTPLYLSEFGGIAYIPKGATVPSEAWGYAGVEKSQEAALARLRGIYQGIAKLPEIIGICYTQLTDVEQEINGLLTYDRKPKFDAAAIREINDLLR